MTKGSILLLLTASVSAAAGQLLFKLGADGRDTLLSFVNTTILIGLLLYGVGTAIWIYALSREQLVNVYPFTALTFVLVMLAGCVYLKEKVSISGGLGIALVVVGLYLIARPSEFPH